MFGCTRSRVAGEISGWSFSALLTVATDTPHSFARSFRDGIARLPPSEERFTGDVLHQVLNRFRNFIIAYFVRKIKLKRITFIAFGSILAFCSFLKNRNCAPWMDFVTFRLKSKDFRCSFVTIFAVYNITYKLCFSVFAYRKHKKRA